LPTLWVVGTPIGNLSDLSERAIETLKESSLILCEDTRRTAQLCQKIGIKKPLERLDRFTEKKKTQVILERILSGDRVSIVSDAGTPCISDPASYLVDCAQREGIKVVPIPGASAVLGLMSASGFSENEFTFRGYFPRKRSEQEEELKKAYHSQVSNIFVWFESPLRILKALECIAELYPDCRAVAGKEMTKIYERFFYGNAQEVFEKVKQECKENGERGEWSFALHFINKSSQSLEGQNILSVECEKFVSVLIQMEIPLSEITKHASHIFGIRKNDVYEFALNKKKQKK